MAEKPEAAPESLGKPPEAPEMAKWGLWVWHHTKQNREALMKPPVWGALLLFSFAAYHYGINGSDDLIKLKDERIGFLNDQLSAYKNRLNGATPDQAAKKISALEAELTNQKSQMNKIFPEKFRSLTKDQNEKLLQNITQIRNDIKGLIIYYYNIGDSMTYASEFASLFIKNGVRFVAAAPVNCALGEKGIMVGVLNPDKPSKEALDFIRILNGAGIYARKTKWIWVDKSNLEQDFDLFICPD